MGSGVSLTTPLLLGCEHGAGRRGAPRVSVLLLWERSQTGKRVLGTPRAPAHAVSPHTMRAQLRGAARRAALGPPSRGAAAGAAQRSVFTAPQFTGPLVFVGAYTRTEGHVDGKGEGIKSYRMSPVDGSLLPLCGGLATPAGPNPTFLVANRAGTRLYAVNECYDGTDSTVTALSIDRASGRLEVLGSAGTGGVAGCFVTLDASEQYVLAANYGSGSVAVIPTDEVTGVGPGVEHKQHAGEPLGPNEARQTDGPHAHAIVFGADATVAYSPDLGLDSVIRYSFDAKTGALEQVGATNASLPGAGPRHMAWSPCGKHAYVSNELSASVTTFALQEESGKEGELKSVHHDSTLPSDWEMGDWLSAGGPDPENGISQCAHVEVPLSPACCFCLPFVLC